MSLLQPHEAEQLLAGFGRYVSNPRGEGAAPADLVRGGYAYALTSGGQAQAVYVLKVKGDQVWISAAHGAGDVDWTAIGLPVIERQAREAGAASIAFETKRLGLVRKAARYGFNVAGFIVRKDLQR